MTMSSQSGDRIIMSWDIALSETETGDYSACVVLLRRQEVFYVLEVVRGRFPFDTLKQKVMEVKRRYGAPPPFSSRTLRSAAVSSRACARNRSTSRPTSPIPISALA